MIRDPKQLSLEVIADEGEVTADASVGMGLITTELLINALKHAFPGHKRGTITVAYHSNGPSWVLSVSDNGVGMPIDPESLKPALRRHRGLHARAPGMGWHEFLRADDREPDPPTWKRGRGR
jgi:two-component sensor histidine kinase